MYLDSDERSAFGSTLPSELLIHRTAEIEPYDDTCPVTSKEILVET